MRARTRAREAARPALQAATCRRQAFLPRHDIRHTGQAPWGPAHLRWRRAVVCPTPAQHIVFQEDGRAVTAHTARLQRLEHDRQEQVTSWRVHPVVDALQARRGVQCTGAVTTVAALGDPPRFDTPRPLMKCLGLLPSEYASRERRRPGAIANAGTMHAPRALGDGAWASRYPATVRRH
jgi:transposase